MFNPIATVSKNTLTRLIPVFLFKPGTYFTSKSAKVVIMMNVVIMMEVVIMMKVVIMMNGYYDECCHI